MSDAEGFYRAFEDRERGSRELVLSRLAVYRPLLEYLSARYPEARALDVGCGRGEWLQLLQSVGIQGHGVDLDAGMLEACRAAQLSVEQGDGLAWLATQPDNSLALISAFHVVEHVPFALVQQLAAEAHRVLLPGGLLIMETPNPENLSVGAHTFYLDPSHERPLPPRLLQFVPEFVGFERSWLWRLQEAERLQPGDDPLLGSVLLAVSPDYAVIARKAGEGLAELDQLLDRPRGRGLEQACSEYDGQHQRRYQQLAGQFEQLTQRLAQAEAEVQRHQQQLVGITHSFGWLLKLPFRWLGLQRRLLRQYGLRGRGSALLARVRALSGGGGSALRLPFADRGQRWVIGARGFGRRLVRRAGAQVRRSQRLRQLVLAVLARSPRLSVFCRRLYLRSQLSDSLPVAEQSGAGDRCWLAAPRADAVHAQQRTPLEAHFHDYVERK